MTNKLIAQSASFQQELKRHIQNLSGIIKQTRRASQEREEIKLEDATKLTLKIPKQSGNPANDRSI